MIMTIYDFSSAFYFQDNYDKIVMIEYVKKTKQITQKQINEESGIPVSNYQRAQKKGFSGYEDMVLRMADYLNIKTNLDEAQVNELDENFSHFYTCICFSRMEDSYFYYNLIMSKRDYFENSIMMIVIYMAQLIHFITDINYTRNLNIEKQEEAIFFLRDFVDKMSNEHRYLFYEYMATYAAIKKDAESVIHYARLTAYLGVNYPELEPTSNYHISFSYSLVGDFINALIYANKSLPKLEEQLNYNKAVMCRVNVAALYKKLGNIDESKKLLKKNLVYMSFNAIDKLRRATELNYADCLLMEFNYKDALKHYTIILNDIQKKPDYESIMAVYCMYMMNDKQKANEYVEYLEKQVEVNKYSEEYFSLIRYFRAYFNKEARLPELFKAAEEFMPGYRLRGSYIQDIAIAMHQGDFQKKFNKPIADPSLAEYIL